MNIINCRECGGKIGDKDAKCPHCGTPSGRALKKDELNENEKGTTERNMDAEKSNSGDIAEEIRNIKLQYESMHNEMKELFEQMRAGHDIIGNKISWLDEQNEQRKKSLEDIISKTSSRYSL